MPLELHELWITPALFNSLHFQAKCWLYGVKFSLTYNFTFDSKPSFDLSIFEVSNFLLKIALQCFLFTNLTIVLSELLSSLWQFSTSFLVIAIFIALKIFFLIFHQGFVEGCPEFQYYFSLYIAQVYCEKFQLQWAFCPTIQLYFSVEHYSLWAVGELAS